MNIFKREIIEDEPEWYKFYDDVPHHLTYPNYSIYKMVEKAADKYPKNYAYNYFGNKTTYAKFIDEIDDVAKSLKVLGAQEDERITICMPNTPEAIATFYAVNKIGAIASMIHPLSAENEIKYYLNITQSKILFTVDIAWKRIKNIIKDTTVEKVIVLSVKNKMPKYMQVAYNVTKENKIEKPVYNESILNWKTFIKNGEDYNKNTYIARTGEDEAVVLYSGGTSGTPKGIRLSNYNFNAEAMSAFQAANCLKPGDKVLAIMPIFHGFGLGVCVHTILSNGGQSVLLPQFSAKEFHKLIKKYKPNFIIGVPTLYEALLNNRKIKNMNLSFVKCAISGGDSLSINLKNKIDIFFREHGAKIQIREGYGLTEGVAAVCLTPKDFYREGSIGIPLPDTYFKIVKPGTTKECKPNEVGEITIYGPTVMMGYLNNEKETKETLIKHKDGLVWLHTGDLGYMDEDGFVYYKQRQKRMIISSGYNVYPQHIENIIDSHPSVLVSCVVGIKHSYKQEVAKAFVVLKDGIEATEEIRCEIMEFCKKNLAKYELPYEIEFRNELPKTLVGKVAYTILQKEEAEKQEKEENKDK